MENQEIVCYCSNVTKGEIVTALNNGAKTIEDIRKMTGACTKGQCKELSPRGKCCSPIIMQVIKEYEEEKDDNLQFIAKKSKKLNRNLHRAFAHPKWMVSALFFLSSDLLSL